MKKKIKRSVNKWIAKNQKEEYIGLHLIADFWGGKIFKNSKEIEKILIESAIIAQNTPLKVSIHKFPNKGITGVVLLAESHIAVHSWPEFDYLAIDIFTCGKKSFPYKALDYLIESFQPQKVKIKEIKRGKL